MGFYRDGKWQLDAMEIASGYGIGDPRYDSSPSSKTPDQRRIAELEAENAELRKDAARYRWLRDQHQGVATKIDAEWFEYTEPTDHAWMVFRPTAEFQSEPVSCIPGELDAAIDAAMGEHDDDRR